MNEHEVLEKVKAFAAQAHDGQKRKYRDELYIEHPIRVMETVRSYTTDLATLCACLLHDVLEDTHVSSLEVRRFLADVIGDDQGSRAHKIVVELTDVYTKKDYPMLNRRTRKQREFERLALASGEAHTVKYADVIDNSVDVLHYDADFALVMMREYKQLLTMINKGNAELHMRAGKTVDECLREYWNKANVKAL